MKFCENCGAYMQETKEGYTCPQCGKLESAKIIEVRDVENHEPAPVYTVDDSKIDYVKVNQQCPQCGNPEAFRQLSMISGDHAGIKQERTLKWFKCTKCSYSWSES